MAGLEIIKPIKTNIIFSTKQSGGFATDILDALQYESYTWLKTDNNMVFKLNTKNTKRHSNLKYLAKGKYTAVFGIELIEDPDNKKNWDPKYNSQLILRVTTENSQEIIDVYNKDKPIFTNNLLDLYLYGEFNTSTRRIGYFTITREYQTDFQLLNITNKIKVIKDYFKVIVKASEHNIFYRDQKYANIGYELVDDEPKFIILDYDTQTLLNIDNWIILQEFPKKALEHYFFGTFPPNYMIYNSLFKPELINKSMFDKLYVGGMVDILSRISVFPFSNFSTDMIQFLNSKIYPAMSNRTNTTTETLKIIKNINILYSDTADYKKSVKFGNLISNKDITITELFDLFLKDIVLQCIQLNYIDVLSIDDIKIAIQEIDNIFLNLLCKIENPEIQIQLRTNPDFNKYFNLEETLVGGYKQKYLKYKQKYLELKKSLN